MPDKATLHSMMSKMMERAGSEMALSRLIETGRLNEVAEIRPFNLEMDLVNKCNLRCTMCMMSHASHLQQPLRRMPLDTFESLAHSVFWHVNALSFTYGAEPLLHPDFARFLEIASAFRIPRIYAVTNGLLLNEDIARAAVKHSMNAIAVSIDAATKETYESIRIGGDWDRLLSNLQMLQRIKGESNSIWPRLELAFVMMRSNIRELPAFMDLAASLGAGAVNVIHMVPFAPLDTESESCSMVKETTNQMLRKAREKARQHGIAIATPPLFGEVEQRNPGSEGVDRFGLPVSKATREAGHCPFPWHFVAIDMRGDVVPCGWWTGQKGMGNIFETPFLSIWKSPQYRQLREQHRTRNLCQTCQRCPAAGVGSVDSEQAFKAR